MGIDDFNVQSHEVILPYAVLEVVLQMPEKCDLLNQHGDIQARILGFMVPFLDILEASLKISASSLQKKHALQGAFSSHSAQTCLTNSIK